MHTDENRLNLPSDSITGSVLRCAFEVQSASGLDNAHYAQCMNYLKATGLKVCLLINFGKPRLQYKRIIQKQSV